MYMRLLFSKMSPKCQIRGKKQLILRYLEHDFLVLGTVNCMKKYYLALKLVPFLLPASQKIEYSLTFGQLCEADSKLTIP